jgi:HlyD family secretion protein
VIATPVAGRLARIDLKEGDIVAPRMVIARVDPLPIDSRERNELQARVGAAEASYREAGAMVAQSRVALEQARRELERAGSLSSEGLISRQQLEIAENTEMNRAKELEAARFRAQQAAFEIEAAKSGLLAFEPVESSTPKSINIYSPVRGRVLRLFEKSERVVTAGTPLLELGDPASLEIVIDILSADAVKVKAGTPVIIEGWGGETPLRAQVKYVEPAAFTKVSALGVEEQRVNVIAEFIDPPGQLGNNYRVEARILLWEGKDLLRVPLSALFRNGEGWSVFVVENKRAGRHDVEIGHRSTFEAEILRGLEEGSRIILYPTNQLKEGTLVE